MCLATRPMTYATAMTTMESSAVRAEAGQPWRSQFIDARSYVFGSGSAMADDDKCVHRDVDGKRHAAEHELIGARQTVGIKHRQNIVRDEIALIAGFAACAAQMILERC